jgi:leader peptidase (prepilin peptidase)/N-methyltransferase
MSIPTFLILIPVTHLLLLTIPLAVTDLREKRLPNKYVLPNLTLAFLATIATMFFGEWQRALVTLGIALVIAVIGITLSVKGWIGMGDVKLLTAMSLPLGWFSPLYPLALLGATFLTSALVVVVLALRKRIGIDSSIPLGPYALLAFACIGGYELLGFFATGQ